MKKRYAVLLVLLALAAAAALVLFPRSDTPPRGVVGYCSTETPLYRAPGDAEPFASVPAGTHFTWLFTTPDWAYGCISLPVNGRTVKVYAPWLHLNIAGRGDEDGKAIGYLVNAVGWTAEEIVRYGMDVPQIMMRGQLVCVNVTSRVHPEWRYYIWLDLLTDTLHDVQTPFIGATQLMSESDLRMQLRSGTWHTPEEIRAAFIACYGPESSWTPALALWAQEEMSRAGG